MDTPFLGKHIGRKLGKSIASAAFAATGLRMGAAYAGIAALFGLMDIAAGAAQYQQHHSNYNQICHSILLVHR